MQSNHYTITVPLDASWVYQNLFLNEDSEGYDVPRTVIFSNKSDKNMIIKAMSKEEDDGAAFTGIFLKANSQLQFKDIGLSYRVGVSFETAQAGTEECIVSVLHYNHVTK